MQALPNLGHLRGGEDFGRDQSVELGELLLGQRGYHRAIGALVGVEIVSLEVDLGWIAQNPVRLALNRLHHLDLLDGRHGPTGRVLVGIGPTPQLHVLLVESRLKVSLKVGGFAGCCRRRFELLGGQEL